MNLSTHKKSEVDLRVAQELKNNQDFIYETNQTLQGLSQGMISLSLQHEKLLALLNIRIKEIDIEFENLRQKVEKTCKECVQKVGDLTTENIRLTNLLEFKFNDVYKNFMTRQEFIKHISPEMKKLETIEKETVVQKDYFNQAVSTLRNHVKEQMKELKVELTPEVPEVDPVKEQLDERMKIFKVDFDGLVREINLLKKAQAYDEKKFENIYTLIERLKAR